MKTLLLLITCTLININLNAQSKPLSPAEMEKYSGSHSPAVLSKGGITIAATSFFSEDFDGGLPAGWDIIDSITPPNGEIWQWSDTIAPFTVTAGTDSFSTNGTTAANGYMIYNSDAYGNNSTDENTSLVSPAINCSMYATVHLGFNHYYRDFSNSIATVFVSNDSTTWTEFAVYDATSSNPEAVDLDISSVAANQASVYVRFRYTGSWGWYWMIDDVQLSDAPITGLSEAANDKGFHLYPNPSNGLITVVSALSTVKQISVVNSTGQSIYNSQFANMKTTIDLSNFARGIYTLLIVSDDKIHSQRIVLTE